MLNTIIIRDMKIKSQEGLGMQLSLKRACPARRVLGSIFSTMKVVMNTYNPSIWEEETKTTT